MWGRERGGGGRGGPRVWVILQTESSKSFISSVFVLGGYLSVHPCVFVQNINSLSARRVLFFLPPCTCLKILISPLSAIRRSLMSVSLAEWSKLPAVPAAVIISAPGPELCLSACNATSRTHASHGGGWGEFRRPLPPSWEAAKRLQ